MSSSRFTWVNKILFVILMLPCFLYSSAQSAYELDHHMEIGFGGGVLNYTGDLAPKISYKNMAPGIQAFYRHNHKKEVSVFRINVLFGQIKGSNQLIIPNVAVFDSSFSRTALELAAIYEYNFFNYRDIKETFFMSPYLFGGIATSVFFGSENNAIISIPFGVGIKYKLTRNWNLGLEYGARKTFYDRIDMINEDNLLSRSTPSDWYYFLGLNISYTFYQQRCPECSPKDVNR